jgi:hypothetical protein
MSTPRTSRRIKNWRYLKLGQIKSLQFSSTISVNWCVAPGQNRPRCRPSGDLVRNASTWPLKACTATGCSLKLLADLVEIGSVDRAVVAVNE